MNASSLRALISSYNSPAIAEACLGRPTSLSCTTGSQSASRCTRALSNNNNNNIFAITTPFVIDHTSTSVAISLGIDLVRSRTFVKPRSLLEGEVQDQEGTPISPPTLFLWAFQRLIDSIADSSNSCHLGDTSSQELCIGRQRPALLSSVLTNPP